MTITMKRLHCHRSMEDLKIQGMGRSPVSLPAVRCNLWHSKWPKLIYKSMIFRLNRILMHLRNFHKLRWNRIRNHSFTQHKRLIQYHRTYFCSYLRKIRKFIWLSCDNHSKTCRNLWQTIWQLEIQLKIRNKSYL